MNIQELIQRKIQGDTSSHILIYTVLYNAIVDLIKREKGIDISDEIVSVSMNGNFIKLRLKRAILKEEIHHISGKIETEISGILEKMGKKTGKIILILR